MKQERTHMGEDELLHQLCVSLRRVLKWAEAYDPPALQRRDYDADLDTAEALLTKIDGPVSKSRGVD